MSDTNKAGPVQLSRRGVLRNFAATAGGAAVLGVTMLTSREAKAAKVAQKIVGYQDMPKGAQQCDNCSQFVAPDSCKVVDGTIAATGWCKVYVKKPA
jgi:secreted PhoX family phosphatase